MYSKLKFFICLILLWLIPLISYASVSDGTDGSANSLDPYEVGYDFEVGGIYYKITSDSTVTTSEGEKEYSGVVVIPDVVKYNKKTYKITKVSGFRHSPYVTEVTIPKYTETISGFYFRVCSMTGGPGIKSNDNDSIDDTRDTSVVTIQSRLRKVNFNAINCKNVYFSINISTMLGGGYNGFSSPFPSTLKEIEFGENVERIPNGLLYGCEDIEKLIFPKSVKYIGWYIIREKSDNINHCEFYCSDLQEIGWLPKNKDCVELRSSFITYPCGVEHYINYNYATGVNTDRTKNSSMFHDFIGLKPNANGKVNLPKWVKKIAPNAFSVCNFILNLEIPDGVETITQNTFANCSAIEEVTIPTSISHIEENAFNGCKNLKTLYFNAENCIVDSNVFANCTSLTEVVFGDSVKSIPDYIFLSCTSLKTLHMPESLREIGFGAFENTSITEVTIPKNVVSIGGYAFEDCKNLTTLNYNASDCVIGLDVFLGCNSLSNITLGENVTKIPSHIFYNVKKIKNIVIPSSVCEIGENAFQRSGLTQIYIPSTVTKLGMGAFSSCMDLTTVYYDVINSETDRLFADCESLCTMVIGENVKKIPDNFMSFCYSLNNVEIHENVREIGESAFAETSLTEVVIPKNVTKIGALAFATTTPLTVYYNAIDCNNTTRPFEENLSNIIFGEDVKRIPAYLLTNCVNLTQITIPQNISIISGCAFASCDNLKTVYFNAENCIVEVDQNGEIMPFYSTRIENVIFGDMVRKIPNDLLNGCYWVKHIQIPESVEEIGSYAFYEAGIRSVTIPNDVKKIGEKAFFCDELTSLHFNAEDCEFASENPENAIFYRCYSLDTVVFGSKVRKIPAGMFYSNPKFKNLELPENLVEIGECAFLYNSFNEVDIPDSVIKIGAKAFYGYSRMSVKLGKLVREIGELAFDGNDISDITSLNPVPPHITDCVFKQNTYNYTKLKVPTNSVDAYKNAVGWKNFKLFTGIDISSVEDISINNNTLPSYYNLQGIKVDNPQKGLFIKREGNITSKIVID